jgi:hypothetical protein
MRFAHEGLRMNGTTLGGVLNGTTTVLSNNGITGSAQTSILSQLGALFGSVFGSANPNKSAELALASQIMAFAGNPGVQLDLDETLIKEIGLPPAAQTIAGAIAKKLGTAGYDPTAECLQIEEIIRNGG